MIVEKEFLNKIKKFGINTYEAKIWTALLSRGVSTAGELSEISDVPRSRSYDVLESLEKKGFIIRKVGKPIKYIAVSPEEVLERVKKKIKKDSKKKRESLEDMKDTETLNELKELHKKGVDTVDPSEVTGALNNRENTYDQLMSMIKGAEESIYLLTTPQGMVRKSKVLERYLYKAAERGVDVKVSAPKTEEVEEIFERINQFGEARYVKDIESRFCIVDKEELIFMLMHDEEVHPVYDVGVWVNTPFFAETLSELFEKAWESEEKSIKVEAKNK